MIAIVFCAILAVAVAAPSELVCSDDLKTNIRSVGDKCAADLGLTTPAPGTKPTFDEEKIRSLGACILNNDLIKDDPTVTSATTICADNAKAAICTAGLVAKACGFQP